MNKLVFIVLGLLLLAYRVTSQGAEFIFSYLGEEHGLSDNIVNCFLEDSRGIMWVGTYNGLNSFDGSNFHAYKKRKGKNSLANEVIHSLCEDTDGRIWAATDNGVFRYDPVKDVYTNYQLRHEATANSYFNIRCDLHGDIWTSSTTALFRYNPEQDLFDSLYSFENSDGSIAHIRKNGVRPDPAGNGVWMATSAGIMHYDCKVGRVMNFKASPESSLFQEHSTSALTLSPKGSFWFGNNDSREIIEFDPSTTDITRRISLNTFLDRVYVATLFEDHQGRLWLCNWDYDILVLDLDQTDRAARIAHQSGNPRSVASEFFWDAYQDADGTIWLGTTAGISRCNPERNMYSRMQLPELVPDLTETTIRIVEEDPTDSSLWLVTSSQKLIHIESGDKSFEVIDLSSMHPGVPDALYVRDDTILVTAKTGTWAFIKGTTEIRPFSDLPEEINALQCTGLAFIGDSVQWSSDGTRLYYRNNLVGITRSVEVNDHDTDISLMTPDQNGGLWFSLGRDILGYVDHTLRPQRIALKQETGVVGVITSISPAHGDKVWVNMRGSGLYCYDSHTGLVRVFDETAGLTSSRMHKAIVDEDGRIWSTFYHKIAVFIPETDAFIHFSLPFKIDRTNYVNAVTRLKNGHLLVSVANDLIVLFPERLDLITAENNPRISRVKIRDHEIFLQGMEELNLPFTDNTVRLQFGTLTDREFFPFTISYKLDGAEDQWSTAEQAYEALYHNLSPGNYIFRVRVLGQNQYWSSEEATLHFTIDRPWYLTIWFVILMILTGLGTIIFIYRYRLRQKERLLELQGKAQLLEKEKAIVMYDNLKQQLNPHFLFNSLTSLSGLIQFDQYVAVDFLEQLSGIYRYILKNDNKELVSLQEELNFVRLYITLQKTRFREGLQLRISVPDEHLHEKIAPVTLQNMIENAIKHNVIDKDSPLVIEIRVEDMHYLVVRNNLQRKSNVESSNKKGLDQFITLYHYLSDRPVVINESKEQFEIRIPLI